MSGIKDKMVTLALRKVVDMALASWLEGIGAVDDIAYRDGKVFLRLMLEGLANDVEVECSEIVIAPDGSSVKIDKISSNVACVDTALDRFVAGKSFAVPEGAARLGLIAANKVL